MVNIYGRFVFQMFLSWYHEYTSRKTVSYYTVLHFNFEFISRNDQQKTDYCALTEKSPEQCPGLVS